ncbi:MAG: hypothetical protein ACI4F7_12010, partial [Acutalibacteraceae bacterium]
MKKAACLKKITSLLLMSLLLVLSACSPQNPSASSDASENDNSADGVFTVKEPSGITERVGGGEFGFDTSAEDNTKAFLRAVKYLKKHPCTELCLEKGVYRFAPKKRIEISGVENAVINGNGAEFIFSNENYFNVLSCNTLEIKDLTVDWDWEKGGRLASVARVYEISGSTVTFEFPESGAAKQAADEVWQTMNQLDPDTLTPGCNGGAEYWELSSLITDKKYLGNGLVSVNFGADNLSHLEAGQVYLLRHRLYSSAVFYTGEKSENITYRDINIYGAYGSGYVAGGGAGYMLFSGITIGLREGTEDKYRISTTVDAFHIADTMGHFIIENCDISFQGDDCLNVHDNVGVLQNMSGKKITVSCMQSEPFKKGAQIAFKSAEDFSDYPVTATVKRAIPLLGKTVLVLDKEVSDIPEVAIVYNSENDSGNYIVRNNYFHECRARGLLLGSDNGLVENNRFYKTQGAALRVSVDIGDSWMEGTGVDKLVIRKNSFDGCNLNDWSSVIEFVSNYKGSIINGNCFNNIELCDNSFSEFPSL